MINIDSPALFKETLKRGINLFTGAGFSVLESPSGHVLPTATSLCEEICERFSIKRTYAADLECLSNIVNMRAKQQFQEYLREKYTVTQYNPLYNALNKINIRSYITTNIDNLIQCIMDNSDRYSLHDIVLYGAAKDNLMALPYIPLHGEVKNLKTNLYFGKNELVNVDVDNKELFDIMHGKLLEAPTLFWGYGFHDHAIEKTIAKTMEKHKQDVWIQCRKGDKNIDYFRDLGCFVIEADTDQLLKWIDEEAGQLVSSTDQAKESILQKFEIPSRNQLSTISRKDYFCTAKTHWYCIFYEYPYARQYVNWVREKALEQKNVIVTGMPFSGKTTLLMQVALAFHADIKLFLQTPNKEHAKTIINKIKGKDVVIFLEDCCSDIESCKLFMAQPNIRVVGVTDDYAYESSKHIIAGIKHAHIEITEISLEESQRIYEHIPKELKKEKFTYHANREQGDDKISMLEFMERNIENVLTEAKVKEILDRVRENTLDGFEIIALTTYLSVNSSILSTDVLISYFENADYNVIQDKLDVVRSYLKEEAIEFDVDAENQDYYNLRSHLFLAYANNLLLRQYKKQYGEIIRRFIMNVSPYKIFKRHIFKRRAYDAKFFHLLFSERGHDLYERIFAYDHSEYTLQQWALYKACLKDYMSAFADIDKAINMNKNNFSIKNSRAIILFEANKDKNTKESLSGIDEAMCILEKCFYSDKRKVYHVQKYAEFALFLANSKGNDNYVENAEKWLTKLILTKESCSKYTKRLLDRIQHVK